MYVPAHFRVNDERAFARELISAYPFALAITAENEEPLVTHVPCVLLEDGVAWTIAGHLARANPQSAHIGRRAAIVFTGPHGYVSPSWYEASPRNVPTWNYASVACRGTLKAVNDDDTDTLLRRLTLHNEARFAAPWSADEIGKGDYRDFKRAIVAFHLPVETLHVKAKYSQNRSQPDRDRVMDALTALGGSDAVLADAMRVTLSERED